MNQRKTSSPSRFACILALAFIGLFAIGDALASPQGPGRPIRPGGGPGSTGSNSTARLPTGTVPKLPAPPSK